MDNRQVIISQVCKETTASIIASNTGYNNSWDINNGFCDEYADKIERILRTEHGVCLYTLATDTFVNFYFDELEHKASEKSAAIYSSMAEQLGNAIAGYGDAIMLEHLIKEMPYHIFLYDAESGRYYDAEMPEGADGIAGLPIIKSLIFFSLMNSSNYFQDKPDELEAMVVGVMKKCLAGDTGNCDKWKIAENITKDAKKACPGLSLEVEQLIHEAREALVLTKA